MVGNAVCQSVVSCVRWHYWENAKKIIYKENNLGDLIMVTLYLKKSLNNWLRIKVLYIYGGMSICVIHT